MTRKMVSVPQELRDRMDAADEEVNWSDIACRAFEAILADTISPDGSEERKKPGGRLKPRKPKQVRGLLSRGRAAGRHWAKTHPDKIEVRRLVELYGANAFLWNFLRPNHHIDDPGPTVFSTLRRGPEGNFEEAKKFWRVIAGEEFETLMNSNKYVSGFLSGVCDYWQEVLRHIPSHRLNENQAG